MISQLVLLEYNLFVKNEFPTHRIELKWNETHCKPHYEPHYEPRYEPHYKPQEFTDQEV